MIRRVSKHTIGVIVAILFALFMLGLMVMSAVYLVAYVTTLGG